MGIGADADIAIYDFNCPIDDLASNYEAIEKGFTEAAYTIKDGEIVFANGEIQKDSIGRTFRVKAEVPKDWTIAIQDAIEERFRKYYTVNLNNYAVQKEYFPRDEIVQTNTK